MANQNNVDTRIVEMEFDNDDFQAGAKATLNTLSQLKSSLNFDNVGKSFRSISKAANNIDLSGLQGSLAAAQSGFSALEAMAFGVFQRIGNKAADLGMAITNELLVAQKKAGFAEYELELGSVQTIQASSGKSFDEIYGYLEELNKYADQTIYSFSDMTSSIGKFTNAGVDLDVAVKAIQGISNEAALSGANANEASRAMYNFAQALSSGAVRLSDWKSIELANMATIEFKEQLIETGLELGTLTKKGDKYVSTTTDLQGKVSEAFDATSMFNDSLAHQWLTTDVLTTVLAKYSDETTDLGKRSFAAAQDVKSFSQMIDTLKEATGSGWSETFRLIFGEFEDSKKLWTSVSNVLGDVIDRFSEFRNHALRFWSKEGGRTKTLNALTTLWKIFAERIQIVDSTFKLIFPKVEKMGHVLTGLTNKFVKFTETLKSELLGNERSLRSFQNIWENVFIELKRILDIVSNVVSGVFKIVSTAISVIVNESSGFAIINEVLSMLSGTILDIAKAFNKWANTEKTIKSITDLIKNIWRSIENLVSAFIYLFDILKQVVRIGIEAFSEVFSVPNAETILNLSDGILEFAKSIKITEQGARNIKAIFKAVFLVFKLFGTIIRAVTNAFSSLLKITDKKGNSIFIKIADKIGSLIEKFILFITESNLLERAIKGIGSAFTSINQFVVGLTGKSLLDNLLGIFDFFVSFKDKIDFEALGRRFRRFADLIATKSQYIWTNILRLGDENTGPAVLVNGFKDLSDALTGTGDSAETFSEKIKNIISETKDKVTTNIEKTIVFFKKVKKTLDFIFGGIAEIAMGLGASAAEITLDILTFFLGEEKVEELKKSGTLISDVWTALEELAEANDDAASGKDKLSLDGLKDALKKLYEGCKEVKWLVDLIIDAIFKIQVGLGVMRAGTGIKNTGAAFKSLTSFGGVIDAIENAAKQITGALKLKALAGVFISFGELLLIIFGIIVGITAIFAYGNDKVIKGFIVGASVMGGFVVVLGVVLGVLVHKVAGLSAKNKNFQEALYALSSMIHNIARVMLSFAVSVAILGLVYEKLGLNAFLAGIISLVGLLVITFLAIGLLVNVVLKNSGIGKSLIGVSKIIVSMGAVMRSIGFAMIEMAAAMWIIAKVSKDEEGFNIAAKTVAVMFAGLLLVIWLLVKLAHTTSGANLDNFDDIIKQLGNTMLKFAIAMALITLLAKDDIAFPAAVAAMAGLIGMIAVLFVAMGVVARGGAWKAIDEFGDVLTQLGSSMIMFSISLIVIAEAIKILKGAQVTVDDLSVIGLIVAGMVIAIGALALLSKAIPGGGVVFILIATALVILSAAVIGIAYALKKFEEVDLIKVADGLYELGSVAAWIFALGLSMIFLGAGCAVLGVGMWPLVISLGILLPLLEDIEMLWPKLVESLTNFDAKAVVDALFEAFVSTLEALASMFSESNNSRVANAIVGIVTGLLGLIAAIFKELGNSKMAEVGADLIDSIINGWNSGDYEKKLKSLEDSEKMDKAGYKKVKLEDGSEAWVADWAENAEEEEYVKRLEKQGLTEVEIRQSLEDRRRFLRQAEQEKEYAEATKKSRSVKNDERPEVKEEKKDKKDKGKEKSTEKPDKESTNYEVGEKSGENAASGFASGFEGKSSDIQSALSNVFGRFDFNALGSGWATDATNGFSGEDFTSILENENGEVDVPIKPTVNASETDWSSLMPSQDELAKYNDPSYINDITAGDYDIGTVSTEMSQETNAAVNASLDEETKTLYSSLKQAVEDLNTLLDGVTIVSNEATLQFDANIDGETAATAIAPFADVLMEQSRKKAKSKQAQAYPGQIRK